MTQDKARRSILAGTGNRVLALALDLLLLVVLASALNQYAGPARPYFIPMLFIPYFIGMPLTPLQGTLGKWVCRIKICDKQGKRLGLRASAIRALATIGWFCLPLAFGHALPASEITLTATELWRVVLALPWATAGFMPYRETVFDLLAGTLVVTFRADEPSVVHAEPAQKRRILNGIGTVFSALIIGYILNMVIQMQQVREMHVRITYAISETQSLRNQVEEFFEAEKRWPTVAELGTPDWHRYPDGGGYRLQPEGKIVITFTELPALKGRCIVFTPKLSSDKKIDWLCNADPGLARRYLPGNCRH